MNFSTLCLANLEQHAEIVLARLTEAQRQLETARSEATQFIYFSGELPDGPRPQAYFEIIKLLQESKG